MTKAFLPPSIFSQGKNPPKNEDSVGSSALTVVLADGATDVVGQDFNGKSGGELISQLIVDTCLQSRANGIELVEEVTAAVASLYRQHNPKAIDDARYRFASSLLCVRIVDESLRITQVGDSLLRINQDTVYRNDKLVDSLSAAVRKEYITRTQDIAGSRDYILPLLQNQRTYQNTRGQALSYGVIDGTEVPKEFIKTFTYPVSGVETVELVSDGYYGEFPSSATIEDYEKLYQQIETVDPYKIGEFASVKEKDDRTVMVSKLSRDESLA